MDNSTAIIQKTLNKRYRRERIFRVLGLSSLIFSFLFLTIFLYTIIKSGLPAFQQTYIKLDVEIDPAVIGVDASSDRKALFSARYSKIINNALYTMFPDVEGRKDRRELRQMVSKSAAYQLRDNVIEDPSIIGTRQSYWFVAKDGVDQLAKGKIDANVPEAERSGNMSDLKLSFYNRFKDEGRIETRFNTLLFVGPPSQEPELAGLKGAILGSFYTMLVTLILAFPIGVAAAAYLEEFAPQNNRWVDIIEININNLAAVPSIVFGLLGLAIFINLFGVPRSTPLVGGLVLALMTLPTIIIASRAAIKSVPPSIKEAAIGMGASPLQTLLQHTLPLAMPGILTGTIIGMAQALGETAPLLMIGMVSFVAEIPGGITDPASVMPVQIYQWSDKPQIAFNERTSAAIMVLLSFLIVMNLAAIFLRKKFERRW